MSIKIELNTALSVKNIFFLCCVFYSGGAISFYGSIIGYILLLIFTFFTLYYYKVKISNQLILVLSVWTVYILLLMISLGDYVLSFNLFCKWVVHIFASYTLIKLFKIRFFLKYERIVVILSIISLLFWVWRIISEGTLLSFASVFNIGETANNKFRNSSFYYLIIYTVEIFNSSETFLPRNYGFCMEPGVFSCWIVIALFLNIMRTDFRLKCNYPFFILLVTLLTTQSTTGIVTFGVLCLFYFICNKKLGSKRFLILLPLSVLLVVFFINASFLFPKIRNMFNDAQYIEEDLDRGANWSAGRIGGLYIGWKDLQAYPLLGKGSRTDRSYAYKGDSEMVNTNGFAGIMSNYGLFGLFVYFFLLFKTSSFLSVFYGYQSDWMKFIFMLVYTALLNGFGIYSTSIFFTFLIYGYFVNNKIKYYTNVKYINSKNINPYHYI